jgi:hypothetical protein
MWRPIRNWSLGLKTSHNSSVLCCRLVKLEGGVNKSLVRIAKPFLFRPDVDCINLDDSAQLFNHAVLAHRKAETVHHEPNRFVGDSGHSVNLVGTHALLAGTEQVGSKQPTVQGSVGVLEDRANCDGELFAAAPAFSCPFADGLLGAGTGFQLTSVIDFSAVRADRDIGPSNGFIELAGRYFRRQCGQ